MKKRKTAREKLEKEQVKELISGIKGEGLASNPKSSAEYQTI